MAQALESSLRLVSGPYKKPGLYPMLAALAIGFGFSIAWLSLSIALVATGQMPNVAWGVMVGLCTILYCIYMGYVGYQILRDKHRHYVLEVSHCELVLTTLDRLNKKKATQMVLLEDVKYAEYYPYKDSSCLILHSPYATVEIPLWPLGEQGQDLIDFLAGREIKIVNVQLDDSIPN